MCGGPVHAHCPDDGRYGRKNLAGGNGATLHQPVRNGSTLLDQNRNMVPRIQHR